ncbi:erythromycin esterase family protein [Alkalimonas amylolytica]|uniref:Erythromycin esterase homolog n=1 Tax=Alkalimonas amylolytica TaxID=152573 RepID=A0A1H4FUE4_ALKAM|nr:erythromycin esterase family protein [Alkalimonas amylolytica]SEB00946.1 Erythromycin esterase homolog [Alkalimonas amylolytica]
MSLKRILVVACWCCGMAALPVVAAMVFHPLQMPDTAVVAEDDFSDLAPLGQAIGDKRVVMLDELTHGEGNVFASKSRIVQYLHQQKGFDVLVLESGLFDVDRIWQSQQDIQQQAPGNIFYMYARSSEMQSLFQYIHQARHSSQPLALAGFDGRFSGELSLQYLVAEFRDYVAAQLSATGPEAYFLQLQQLLEGQFSAEDPGSQQQFLSRNKHVASLLQAKMQADGAMEAGFWYRINASLRKMAQVAWQQRRFDEHDLAMAANLQWLIEQQYAGHKIIVWGHYIHLNRQGGFEHALHKPETPIEQRSKVANMTSALPEAIRKQTYVLHFAGAQGSYIDFRDMQEIQVESGDDMMEQFLTEQAGGDVFVSLQQVAPAANRLLWGHEYKSTLSWQQAQQRFDGMILLHSLTPTQQLDREQSDVASPELDKLQ